MIKLAFFKFSIILFFLFSLVQSTNSDKLVLKTDGWKKVMTNELPKINEELKFFQIKNITKFNLKTIRNPFNTRLDNRTGKEIANVPFKLIFLTFEFWSKFNESSLINPSLVLTICDDNFSWPVKRLKRQTIFKKFDKNDILLNYVLKYDSKTDSCLSDFTFSIIGQSLANSTNSNKIKDKPFKLIEIDEFNIIHLGVYYSTVDYDLTLDENKSNLREQLDQIWHKIENKYESEQNKSTNLEKPIRYECKFEDCKSFLLNDIEIKNRMFYPKLEWKSFFESRKPDEILNLKLDGEINFISNYSINFFYFITQPIKLQIFTSLNYNTIIDLYTTYSYSPDKEFFKWLPVEINLKDILPYGVNSVDNLIIYIQTKIDLFKLNQNLELNNNENSIEFKDNLKLAAISNIKLNSDAFVNDQKLTDYLTNWDSNGKKAMNEWTCLIDQTMFYNGRYNENKKNKFSNFIIEFFTPKYKSSSTYLLLSKWFVANNQKLQIKILNELDSHLKIDTIDENLKIINSQNFVLHRKKENFIDYDVLSMNKIKNSHNKQAQIVRIRLTFEIQNLNNQNKPKKILIQNLNMNDPCGLNTCIHSSNCITFNSTSFECVCLSNYHGQKCEFHNVCLADNEIKSNYCKTMSANCQPIGNSFKCNCKSDQYWTNDHKICQDIPKCYHKEKIDNQCVYNHSPSFESNGNWLYKCNRIFESNSFIDSCLQSNACNNRCSSGKETCISTLQSSISHPHNFASFCACDLNNGYLRNRKNKCELLDSDQKGNPFISKSMNCSHDYKINLKQDKKIKNVKNLKFKCTCPPGYKMRIIDNNTNYDQDYNPLKNPFYHLCQPDRYCDLECPLNQYCTFNESNDSICECEIGFTDFYCALDFCKNPENSKMIKRFCGNAGCNFIDNRYEPEIAKFVCNCDEKFYSINKYTGLCEFKDVCGNESKGYKECLKKDAICMPHMNESKLTYNCVCPKGWHEDSMNKKCKKICSFHNSNELANENCYLNLKLDSPEFECKPGFYRKDNICILSGMENKFELIFEARININQDMYLNFNRLKNDHLVKTNVNCSKFILDSKGCARKVNESILKLEELSNSLLFNESYIYSMNNLINISLQSILGDDLFSSQILRYNKIDLSNSIDLMFSSKLMKSKSDSIQIDKETKNSKISNIINKNATSSDNKMFKKRPYFQVLNISVYLETYGFHKNLNEKFFIPNCKSKFCPLYPYLHIRKGTFKIKRLYLNQTKFLTQCFPASSPVYESNSNSNFRCSCLSGYKEIAKISISNNRTYFKAICFDENECIEQTDHCNPNTTNCYNLNGGYRCDCKNDSMVQIDNFHCHDPCSPNLCKEEEEKCIPYQNSYACLNKNSIPNLPPNPNSKHESSNSSFSHFSTGLLLSWACLLISMMFSICSIIA